MNVYSYCSAIFNIILYRSYIVIGVLTFIIALYWLFYIPCNWTKQIDDINYASTTKKYFKKKSTCRKEIINLSRRLRKIDASQLPPPFPNGWYSILESTSLKIGEAKSVSCLGENFVVYRNLEKKVFVLDAYCPHMGANLGIGGRVIGNSIECPFHHWRFDGYDGKCVYIPYSCASQNNSKVRKWISYEVNGNIFVWYHAENDVKSWNMPIIKEIDNLEFVYHGRNEFYIHCHIQEIPENAADFAHFKSIHTTSVLGGGIGPNVTMLENTAKHQWQSSWSPSEKPTKHLAFLKLKHAIELTSNYSVFTMNVVGQQIGPAYVQLHMELSTLGRIEVLQTITPIEPLLQKVVHQFYAPRKLAPFIKFLIWGESIMFERDITIWNHKIYRPKPQLIKEEASVKTFRNWYLQFYSENSKSFAEASSSCPQW